MYLVRCDRCGREVSKPPSDLDEPMHVREIHVAHMSQYPAQNPRHLCEETCLAELDRFLQGYAVPVGHR